MRTVRCGAVFATIVLIVACRESTTEPAHSAGPLFSVDAVTSCPTPAAVTVTDEASLRAALAAATPGEVIGLDGFFAVTADITVAVENVTLTCVTPGAGIFAAAEGSVVELVTAGANGVVVDHLVLDGSAAQGDAYFAGAVAGVRLTSNTVTCSEGCAFFVGTREAVIADNYFESAGGITGVHLQMGFPGGPNDGTRIERNTIVATAPAGSPSFGGLRVRDGTNVTVTDNLVLGPWSNSIAPADLTESRFQRNRLEGAAGFGIRFATGPSFVPISMTDNVFAQNIVTGAATAGIFARLACRNTFAQNDLNGNGGNIGLTLDATTGANIVVLPRGNTSDVIDNGSFDCDGDGQVDPNRITGPGRIRTNVAFQPPAGVATPGTHRLR
jgi:hypothetical protein